MSASPKEQAIAEYVKRYKQWVLGDASMAQVIQAERAAHALGATDAELDKAKRERVQR